jgi:acyl dehydratase
MAKNLGLPGIIVQGTALLAVAVRRVLEREGVQNPHAVLVVSGQFRSMVFPGQSCLLRLFRRDALEDTSIVLHFELLVPDGRRAIQAGRIELNSTLL